MTDWWKLFHVGKKKFNTGIKIKLLQDYVLVSGKGVSKQRNTREDEMSAKECN